jgi:hypothetical protein
MQDNNWYEGIEKEINSLKEKMSKSDYQLYEVELLLRVTKRVSNFSSDCKHCQGYRNDISKLVSLLDDSLKMSFNKEANYGRTLRSIIKHLKDNHKIRGNIYNSLWFFIPAMVGIGLWKLLDSWVSEAGSGAMGAWIFYSFLGGFILSMLFAGILWLVRDIWFREKL